MEDSKKELLAPAGSMDALRAALANGADAVYLGAAAFGARQSAGFDQDTLQDALRLAHLHKRKIYVTVNILVKERELADLRSTLSLLARLGADAVLVQDLGVLKICREEFPSLPVHASTQMALHNAQGAALVKALGAKRAVMARECDLASLARCAKTGIEIEAFCHGALCVSCSGQCLFSSMIGGRSGNRGRCAQPCRLPYTYQGATAAWLSPRDLCARDEVRSLCDAGVYSLKIEGRLKRPEYVAVVTRSYRKALDAVLEGRFEKADPREKESLTQIFSRGGFTLGYPGGEQDAAIIHPQRVTPVGIQIGKIQKVYQKSGVYLADAFLSRPLHNGDGLEIGRQEIRYSGPEVQSGSIATLRLRDAARPGEALRRTEDESQLMKARETYEGEALNKACPIPFDAFLTAYPGSPLSLRVTDGEKEETVSGENCQAAESKALNEESAKRAIEKTGGTPFVLRRLSVKTANAFAPASALNALRREALEALAQRRETPALPHEAAQRFEAKAAKKWSPRLIVKTAQAQDIPFLLQAGADEILLYPRDFRPAFLNQALKAIKSHPQGRIRLCLPSQLTEEEQEALSKEAREALIPVCLSSPSQLKSFGQGVMAGEGIPLTNGETARLLLYLGCQSATVSRELSKEEILELPQDACELILPVYGRTRLMLLNHCPMRTKMGLTRNRSSCDLCAQGKGTLGTSLTDRLGAEYPLVPVRLPSGCQIELCASQPQHLGAHLEGMERFSWLISFSDETAEQRKEIVSYYVQLRKGESPAPLSLRGTLGRFQDGVL